MRVYRRSGFTLIELLITIVIIGVVLSIIVSALAASRMRATEIACVSAIKQAAVLGLAAATEQGDRFPAAPYEEGSLASGRPAALFGLPGGLAAISVDYFAQVRSWPLLIAGDTPIPGLSCAGLDPADRVVMPALTSTSAVFGAVTTFEVSETMISEDRLWSASPTVHDRSFRPQPLAQVLFPSAKVLFFERWSYHGRGRPVEFTADDAGVFPIVFVDGSARITQLKFYKIDDSHPVSGGVREPLAHTLDGIRGRDTGDLGPSS